MAECGMLHFDRVCYTWLRYYKKLFLNKIKTEKNQFFKIKMKKANCGEMSRKVSTSGANCGSYII